MPRDTAGEHIIDPLLHISLLEDDDFQGLACSSIAHIATSRLYKCANFKYIVREY